MKIRIDPHTAERAEERGASETEIIDAEDQTHTTITTSTLNVSAEQIEALHHKVEATLDRATCVITGGTLPVAMEGSMVDVGAAT